MLISFITIYLSIDLGHLVYPPYYEVTLPHLILSSQKQRVDKTALSLSKLQHTYYLIINILKEASFIPRRLPPQFESIVHNNVRAKISVSHHGSLY
jgi:hypothetical protein